MSLFDSARFRLSVSQLAGLPEGDVPEIAFAGRSNAGKSTTINVLTRQGRLAFASKTPGRTQLINFFDLSEKDEHGHRQCVASLVDLPGYGFAKAAEGTRKTWSELIGGYLASRDTLTGIVVVMDARRPLMPTDEWVIDFLNTRPVKMHWLLNKCDQLNNQAKKETLYKVKARAAELDTSRRARCLNKIFKRTFQMHVLGHYPQKRMRRMRHDEFSRRLMRENTLTASDLILPVFVMEGEGRRQAVPTMPGVERMTPDELCKVAQEMVDLGIPMIALFPAIEDHLKTPDGREAANPGQS